MNYVKIKKAVFPVAGFGTRFLPVTKSQPKEMLPVVDKPVIHYLVEEAVQAGIEEIIIVTGRGKRSIEDYFDQSFELEHNLVEQGKSDLLKEVLEIPNLAKFIYVRQPLPKGDGDAVLQCYSLLKNEPFAVLFGDDLVVNDVSALTQLMQVYEQFGTSVIGTVKVPESEVENYGIVDVLAGVVNSFQEKPKIADACSQNAVIGKYIITPDMLELLSQITFTNELKLSDLFIKFLLNGGNLRACNIVGERFDTGSKIGLLKANIAFGLRRSDLGDELRAYMKKLL